MNKNLFLLLMLCISTSLMAVTFTDDFNRANSTTAVGNGWLATGGGTHGISSNRMLLDNGTNEEIGDNFAYYNLGSTLTDVILSGVMNYTYRGAGDESFYITLNALSSHITSNPNTTTWSTRGKGYGIEINPTLSKYYVVDESVTEACHVSSLKSGSITITSAQDYNFEFIYRSNKTLEARFWTIGAVRPTDATISYVPGVAPTFTGTYLAFGITDEGTFQVDNVSIVPVPELNSIILASLGLLAAWILRKK